MTPMSAEELAYGEVARHIGAITASVRANRPHALTHGGCMDTLRRDVRWLKMYALCSTAAFAVLALAAFARPAAAPKTKFEEIDVERINVVEKDGKLRLVISNRDRSPGPIAYGKPFGYPGGTRPGMIFFNDEGSENGGLTFNGKRQADGKYSSTIGMSF